MTITGFETRFRLTLNGLMVEFDRMAKGETAPTTINNPSVEHNPLGGASSSAAREPKKMWELSAFIEDATWYQLMAMQQRSALLQEQRQDFGILLDDLANPHTDDQNRLYRIVPGLVEDTTGGVFTYFRQYSTQMTGLSSEWTGSPGRTRKAKVILIELGVLYA